MVDLIDLLKINHFMVIDPANYDQLIILINQDVLVLITSDANWNQNWNRNWRKQNQKKIDNQDKNKSQNNS